MSLLACSIAAATGCQGPSVEARAIWVDVLSGEDQRQVHVYDRGQRYEFVVDGADSPQERVRLDARGRGLLVRVGEPGGSGWGSVGWFDLDDGRRLPMWLPPWSGGKSIVHFSDRGDALWWRGPDSSKLSLIPLAPGVELEFSEAGNVRPLVEERDDVSWVISAFDASKLLVKRSDDSVSFLSYPDSARTRGALVHEGRAEVFLPSSISERRESSCLSAVECGADVSLEPGGELAIARGSTKGEWIVLDGRASSAAPVELPEALAAAASGGGLGLLHALDRSVSAWIGAGQLFRWDRKAGTVDSAPLFAAPPLWWFPVDHGHGVALLSMTGPMYRVDRDTLEVINLETTDCLPTPGRAPVVSPDGSRAAWTCLDTDTEFIGSTGVVVRASRAGLERYVGVPMGVVAIDDGGDLLVHSFESVFVDQVDGVAATSRPRSLFVLTAGGALSRVDELEPAPVSVLLGVDDLATYMQGAALD